MGVRKLKTPDTHSSLLLAAWCGHTSVGQSNTFSWLWREGLEPVLVTVPASQQPLNRAVWSKPDSSVVILVMVAGFILQPPWQVGEQSSILPKNYFSD